MRVEVHPGLVEEAVFLACRRREAGGDPAPTARLHRALERAYRSPPGPDRDRRFRRVHAAAFRVLGLEASVLGVLGRHPGLASADGPVRVGPPGGGDAVELFLGPGPGGATVRSVVVGIAPAALADPATLPAALHRDAAKVAALLDPAFGWKPGGTDEGTPARRETVRARYRAAWDAWVDGRLDARGLPAPAGEEEGRRGFLRAFGRALEPEAAAEAYGALRAAPALSHADLLRYARDPASLPGAGACRAGAEAPPGPLPGGPCPLCRFPTHDWEPAAGALPAAVQAGARSCRAGWEPSLGLCRQCAMLLRAQPPAPAALPA